MKARHFVVFGCAVFAWIGVACGGSEDPISMDPDVADVSDDDIDSTDADATNADATDDAPNDVDVHVDVGDQDADTDPDVSDVDVEADVAPDLDPPPDAEDDTPDTASDAEDDSSDAGDLPSTFIESFEDDQWWDEASSAVLDLDSGRLLSTARWEIDEDAGDEVDNALVVTENQSLDPGSYAYSDVLIEGATLSVDGDLTLRVGGDFVARDEARLNVSGALTLVVAGRIDLGCAIISSVGDLTIHQPGDEGIVMDCAERVGDIGEAAFHTIRGLEGPHGDVVVQTRGSITMLNNGYMYTGNNQVTGLGGSLHVRAYGDIRLANDSYLIGGNRGTTNLATEVWTEGELELRGDSYLISNSVGFGALVRVRTGAGIRLVDDSYIINNGGGFTEIESDGDIVLERESYITGRGGEENPHQTRITGASVYVDSSYISAVGSSPVNFGGSLEIVAADAFTCINDCVLESGGEQCGTPGSLRVQTNGTATFDTAFLLYTAPRIDASCVDHTPSEVVVRSGGARVEDGLEILGVDTPVLESNLGSIGLTAVDAVVIRRHASSVPITTVFRSDVVTNVEVDAHGVVRTSALTADGDPVAADSFVGAALSPGWRYVFEADGRFFDDAWVDELRVTF